MFVLGDNRDFSYDSRFRGPVPIESITGRVLRVYLGTGDASRLELRSGEPVTPQPTLSDSP